jgi:hypothetical protein
MSGEDPHLRDSPKGRTFGMVFFGLVLGAITTVFSVQIILQAFAGGPPTSQFDCPATISDLAHALDRARQSAAGQADGDAGIAAFRAALLPDWERLPQLQDHCAGIGPYQNAARTLTRLRYMEEGAVRYGASDLAAARREMADELGRLNPAD